MGCDCTYYIHICIYSLWLYIFISNIILVAFDQHNPIDRFPRGIDFIFLKNIHTTLFLLPIFGKDYFACMFNTLNKYIIYMVKIGLLRCFNIFFSSQFNSVKDSNIIIWIHIYIYIIIKRSPDYMDHFIHLLLISVHTHKS